MLSVIITVHPPLLKHLPRCVDSVAWQLAVEDELLIVGDGVPTEALEPFNIVHRSAKQRINICGSGQAGGVSFARNLGMITAVNPWLKFLDADDLLAPFALNAFRAAGQANRIPESVAVVAGGLVQVHNGIVRGTVPAPDIEALLPRQNPLLVSMAFVRRAAALAVSGFEERLQFEEDWEFWLKLRAAGQRFATLNVPVCYYWVDDAERAAKGRDHTIEGMDVRAWLARQYGVKPQG